jgi:uncharacterized membrane protein YdbT with pleckstrin-like domain
MEEFDLQPGEHVIAVTRQHLFVFVLSLLPFIILALAPLFLSVAGEMVLEASGASVPAIDDGLLRFASGLWWLFLWMAVFTAFMRYYLTQWVITNLRIMDIQQYGFFGRNVSSFLLLRIQDVTTEIDGLLGTLIGYGRLKVQTAGQEDDFSLHDMPHPQRIRDLIMDQVSVLQHGPSTPASSL